MNKRLIDTLDQEEAHQTVGMINYPDKNDLLVKITFHEDQEQISANK